MPSPPPEPSTANSHPPPLDLPSGYKDPQWERDFGNGKQWKVRDQRSRPLTLRQVHLGDAGPADTREYRSWDISRKIGPYGNLLDYRDAWIRTPDGRLIPADQFRTASPETWAGTDLYVVTEWTERSLADRLRECQSAGSQSAVERLGGIPVEELLDYLAGAAAGLDDLRAQGIIHTDLSPANLLLIGRLVKVADYGGVPPQSRRTLYAQSGPFGIACYAAPGLEEREPQFGDDQYALAIIFYHLRTTLLPFPGAGTITPDQARQFHESGSLQFVAVSPAERKVLNRVTLGQNPFGSCQELVESLQTAIKSGAGSSAVIQLPTESSDNGPPSKMLITTGTSTIRSNSPQVADSTHEMPALPLSEGDRLAVSTRADKFFDALNQNHVEDWEPFLEGLTGRVRTAVLTELAIIDIDYRWSRGEQPPVEYYMNRFPELGPANRVPPKLILEEHLCKLKAGLPPDLEGIRRRFPHQFQQIEPELLKSLSKYSGNSPSARSGPGPKSAVSRGDGVLSVSQEYEFIRELGRGMFGEVWLARKKTSGIEKAIKILLQAQDQEGAQRELRSLELIKNLRHPYLLATEDFWVQDNRLHIVMELADGSLRTRFKEHRKNHLPGIPEDELLPYIVEAAEGLDYLHSQKVTHRDVKPDNILLLRDHAKVADFGLAKQQDDVLASATFCGTPAYMAPEVWGNASCSASDQYSLALTYAELRQGKLPIATKPSMQSMMFAHLDGSFEFSPVMSPAETAVLRKAMAKLPEQRYPNCMAFVEDLARALGRPLNRGKSGPIPVPAPRKAAPPPPEPMVDSVIVIPEPSTEHKTTVTPVNGQATVAGPTTPEAPKPNYTPPPPRPKPGTAISPALKIQPQRRQQQRSGSRKALGAIFALGLLAGVAGLIYYLWPQPHPEPDEPPSGPSRMASAFRMAFDAARKSPAPVPAIPPHPQEPIVVQVAPQPRDYVSFMAQLRAAARPVPVKPIDMPKPKSYAFWAKLDESHKLLKQGQYENGLIALRSFLENERPPLDLDPKTREAIDSVHADLGRLLDNGKARSISLECLTQICNHAVNTPAPEDKLDSLRGYYRTLVPLVLQHFISHPLHDAAANDWTRAETWTTLKDALEPVENLPGIDGPWVTLVLIECELMAVPPIVNRKLPRIGNEKDAALLVYIDYLGNARTSADLKSDPKAARSASDQLAKLSGNPNVPPAAATVLHTARRRLAGRLLVAAEKELLPRGQQPEQPYAQPADVTTARTWLKAACDLAANDPDLARRACARLVVAAAFPDAKPELLKGLTIPKTPEELDRLKLEPLEQLHYWLGFVRTRDRADFVATVAGYEQLVAIVARDIGPGLAATRLAFAHQLARTYLLKDLATLAETRADKSLAAKPLAMLARAFFMRRPLMTPANPGANADVVLAADLANAAARLDPQPQLQALAALFSLEGDPEIFNRDPTHFETLERLATTVTERGPAQPAALAFRGRVNGLKAYRTKVYCQKAAILTTAVNDLKAALDARTNAPEDWLALEAMLYRDLALYSFQMANFLTRDDEAGIRRNFDQAEQYAKLLSKNAPRDPRTFDVWGCLREDQAWFGNYPVEQRKRYYADAIKAFSDAIDGHDGNELVRQTAKLHLGRCRYKWANTFPNDPRNPKNKLLDDAEVDLLEVVKSGRIDEQIEALHWLAMIELARGGLEWKANAISSYPEDLLESKAITADAISKARTHLKGIAQRQARPSNEFYRHESQFWIACLNCYVALEAGRMEPPKIGREHTDAITAFTQVHQIPTVRLRSTLAHTKYLYQQLEAAASWAEEKQLQMLWKQLEAVRPVDVPSSECSSDDWMILQIYSLHYQALALRITALDLPSQQEPEAILQAFVIHSRQLRMSIPNYLSHLDRLAITLAQHASKAGTDGFAIAVLSARLFIVIGQIAPALDYLTHSTNNPLVSAQWREHVANKLLDHPIQKERETKPERCVELDLLAEKLFIHIERILTHVPNANDAVVKDLKGRIQAQRLRLDKSIPQSLPQAIANLKKDGSRPVPVEWQLRLDAINAKKP